MSVQTSGALTVPVSSHYLLMWYGTAIATHATTVPVHMYSVRASWHATCYTRYGTLYATYATTVPYPAQQLPCRRQTFSVHMNWHAMCYRALGTLLATLHYPCHIAHTVPRPFHCLYPVPCYRAPILPILTWEASFSMGNLLPIYRFWHASLAGF